MKAIYAIGADIGGSHITAAAVNMLNGIVIERTRSDNSLNNKASSDEIIEKWGSTIRNVIEDIGLQSIRGIGLAMPGPFDYINGISLFKGETHKFENTYGLNVSKSLKDFLKLPADFPVRFINDAAAFSIGEAWKGKAVETNRSLSITLGTGLGSGFICDGLPVFKSENVPKDGFIYHLPYKDGIADDLFSTRGLIKEFKKIKRKEVAGVKDIAKAAENDNDALELMKNFGTQLARFLIPCLRDFEPEVVVVGGNISKAFNLFGEDMQRELFDFGLKIKVERSELNETAQILGAAKIIDDEYWQKVLPRLSY